MPCSDRINRTAGPYKERAFVRSAKGEAAGPLGNLQHTNLPSLSVIEIDLVAGDVYVARFVAHDRGAPAFREEVRDQLPILSQPCAICFPVVLAG